MNNEMKGIIIPSIFRGVPFFFFSLRGNKVLVFPGPFIGSFSLMFSLPTSHADGLISRWRWPARWTVVGSDSHWTFHASLLRSSFDLTLHYLFIYLFIDVPFSLEISARLSCIWKTTSDNGTWLHPSSLFFYYFFVPLFFSLRDWIHYGFSRSDSNQFFFFFFSTLRTAN